MLRALLFFFTLLITTPVFAQKIGVGYYDLDGLYDTIPSKFYDDTRYTPNGELGWNSARYRTKIEHTAAVIDSMSLPIMGLYGVENEAVVRDIVTCSKQDYSYIHRTRNSFDGMDFALLYYGDKLFIDRVEAQRNMLIVDATLEDDSTITIILLRDAKDLPHYLSEDVNNSTMLIMGNIYQSEVDKLGLINTLQQKERRGEGNCSSYRGWFMRDKIITNNETKILKSGVYITQWLLTTDNLSPRPTFKKDKYIGGFSKYLPIFTYIF